MVRIVNLLSNKVTHGNSKRKTSFGSAVAQVEKEETVVRNESKEDSVNRIKRGNRGDVSTSVSFFPTIGDILVSQLPLEMLGAGRDSCSPIVLNRLEKQGEERCRKDGYGTTKMEVLLVPLPNGQTHLSKHQNKVESTDIIPRTEEVVPLCRRDNSAAKWKD